MLPDITKGKGISGTVRYVLGQGTAPGLDQLARQMARVDDRRAASQFHHEAARANERSGPQKEIRETAQQLTARQKPEDERQRKIDEVVQRLKQQREKQRGDRDRDR